MDYPQRSQTLQYQLSLTVAGQKLELVDEAIENEQPFAGEDDVYFYYRYQRGRPVINVKIENDRQLIRRSLRRDRNSHRRQIKHTGEGKLTMLASYIDQAMELAIYEIIEDDKTYWGEIPGLQGVWARHKTLEACRRELREALSDWLALRLRLGLMIPVIANINLNELTQPV